MSARLAQRDLVADQVIGEHVHRLMWKARLSQVQLARLIGVSQGALSRKLRGDRPWFAGEVLAAACVLGVPLEELYGELVPEAGTRMELAGRQPPVMSTDTGGRECSR